MHFFISTLFPLTSLVTTLNEYWKFTNQTIWKDVEAVNSWKLIALEKGGILGQPSWAFAINAQQTALVTCTGNFEASVNYTKDYATTLLSYYEQDKLPQYFKDHESRYSCIVLDLISSHLIMVSDSVQSAPLWYWLETDYSPEGRHQFFVTSDIFVALQFQRLQLNVMPENFYMDIDLKTNEIELISSLYQGCDDLRFDHVDKDVFSHDLLTLATSSIASSLEAIDFDPIKDHIIVEIDDLHWVSKIVDCAAEQLRLTREVRKTRPLIMTDPTNTLPFDISSLLIIMVSDLLRQYDASAQKQETERIYKRVFDRWNICNNPYNRQHGERLIFLSFDTGREMRYEDITIQNFLCSLTNTIVLYPLSNPAFQKKILRFGSPETAMNAAMVLLTDSYCPNNIFSVRFFNQDDIICENSGRCIDQLISYDGNSGERRVTDYTKHISLYEKRQLTNKTITEILDEERDAQILQEQEKEREREREREGKPEDGMADDLYSFEDVTILSPAAFIDILEDEDAVIDIETAKRKVAEERVVLEVESRSAATPSASEVSYSSPTSYSSKISSSFIADFAEVVDDYITRDRFLLLTYVTGDELEEFANYLCHISLLYPTSQSRPNLPLLVLTSDMSIVNMNFSFAVLSDSVCSLHGFGTFKAVLEDDDRLLLCQMSVVTEVLKIGVNLIINSIHSLWLQDPVPHLISNDNSNSAASSSRPVRIFNFPKQLATYDVAYVVSDNLLIADWLVMQANSKTVAFWEHVITRFYRLLEEKINEFMTQSSAQSNAVYVKVGKFYQYVLDHVIVLKEYDGELHYRSLSLHYFTTPYLYYVERKTVMSAMVVLGNNYYSYNDDMEAEKRDRWLRYRRLITYGHWLFIPPSITTSDDREDAEDERKRMKISTLNSLYCHPSHFNGFPFHHNEWKTFFSHLARFRFNSATVSNTTSNPFLYYHIDAPYHNEVLEKMTSGENSDSSIAARAVLEGDLQLKHTPPMTTSLIHAYVNSEPYLGYQRRVMYYYRPNVLNTPFVSLMFLVPKTLIQNSLDLYISNTSLSESSDPLGRFRFGVDYDRLSFTEMTEYLLTQKEKLRQEPHAGLTLPPNLIGNHSDVRGGGKGNDSMSYVIKVLAYNRVDSLQRLLTSLSTADYLDYRNITLEVIIDRFRKPADEAVNYQVKALADAFVWSFGPKKVVWRESNIGLANQWYRAWIPSSMTEIAFIFEDDLEVSPFFFRYASGVVDRYYKNNYMVQRLHLSIANNIHTKIEQHQQRQRESDDSARSPPFDEDLFDFSDIITQYAGYPLMYGVCLQKQPLDAQRYPKTVRLTSAHRPFLYSPIGTWGPLFFPAIWQAFREWWSWRLKQKILHNYDLSGNTTTSTGVIQEDDFPATENLCQNMFISQNPRIWSPYIVRFAYEFGAKCFYSNLPGNLSLVTNHREKGENYGKTSGSFARLLPRELSDVIFRQSPSVLSKEEVVVLERKYEVDLRELVTSLTYFPSDLELAHLQYDFNQRRISSFASDHPYPLLAHLPSSDVEKGEISTRLTQWLHQTPSVGSRRRLESFVLYDTWRTFAMNRIERREVTSELSRLSLVHWLELINMIEANLLPTSHIVFADVTPLVFFLAYDYGLTHHFPLHLLLPRNDKELIASDPCQRLREDYDAFYLHRIAKLPLNHLSAKYIREVMTPTSSSCDVLSASPSSLSVVTNASMLVLPLTLLSSNSLTTLRQLLKKSTDVRRLQYLLVIDNCLSAPSSVRLQVGDEEVEFIAIEELCENSDFADVGGKLYRVKRVMDDVEEAQGEQRVWISRRLTSSLTSSYVSPLYNNAIFV